MINKQLELNVNQEKMLDKLAENLNIGFISEGSNLKKLADTYVSELITYSNTVDDAIKNGFISTMSEEYLEMFGAQNNIYRKNYRNISVYSSQNAVELSINKSNSLVIDLDKEYTVFKKGDVIFNDENIVIESLSNITLDNINSSKYISIMISITDEVSSYIIPETAEYNVSSTNTELNNIVPNFNLTFKRPIGLALLQETEEDYRLRIYEATYLANNGANSLLASVTKEVPFLIFIEVEDYKEGRSVKTIYPYTQQLIEEGEDFFLDNVVLPLVETSLKSKVLYGQLVEVLRPEPLVCNLELGLKNYNSISESLLLNCIKNFNEFFVSSKQLTIEELQTFIETELNLYDADKMSFKFIFTSPYVSEETFVHSAEIPLTIPKGRFIHLSSINKVQL